MLNFGATAGPVAAGSGGAWISMAIDPVGNRFEMVQRGTPKP